MTSSIDCGSRLSTKKETKDASQPLEAAQGRRLGRLRFVAVQFAILFAFWLMLSGHYQVRFVVMGALSSALVTFLTHDLLYSPPSANARQDAGLFPTGIRWWPLLGYLPWLLFSIVVANLQVAYLIVHPRMPIDPALLTFRPQLRSRVAQVVLANSITLTPGTVTVELEEGYYVVHALAPGSAQGLLTGQMQSKVGALFGEEKEAAPVILQAHSIEELEQ